jgi:hypothetical protein
MELELTKKGTPRKRKPKQKIYYFTKDTENAILEYVASADQRFRDKIYRERIDYAFFKLSQNIINTFKFDYMDGTIEDIQQEVIYFLLTKLPLYTQEKGAAYSYFGTIAKRYLILENDKMYKKKKLLKDQVDVEELNEEEKNLRTYDYENLLENNSYLLDNFIKYMELYSEKIFIKSDELKTDKQVLQELEDLKTSNAIIEIFKQKENIEIFNKKAILLYIREMTDQDTQQITKISKKIQKIFNRLQNQYLEYGYISLNF